MRPGDGGADNGLVRAGDYIAKNKLGASGGSRANQLSGDNLPSFQAFFVTGRTSTSITFNSSMILPNDANSNYLKSEEKIPTTRISLSNDTLYNDILIGFSSGNIENIYDALKMKGNPDFSFYTKKDTTELGITTYNLESTDTVVVPLFIELTKQNTLDLTISELDANLNFDKIVLKNSESNTEIELTENNPEKIILSGTSTSYNLLFIKLKQTTVSIQEDDSALQPEIIKQDYYTIQGLNITNHEKNNSPIVVEKNTYSNGKISSNLIHKIK